MADIHNLRIVESPCSDANRVLADAAGNITEAVVIGWDQNGELYFATSTDDPDTLWLIEQAKKVLLEGED